MSILDIISILLVLSGLLFFLGASVGLLRFPDFYTRMHAAGKGDTLSTFLIMAGVGAYELNRLDLEHGVVLSVFLVVIKILAIGIFIMLTSPTSTHALMKAGYDDHIEPVGERDEMELEMPKPGAVASPKTAEPVDDAVEAVVKPAKKTTRKKAPAKKKKKATPKKSTAKKSTSKKKAPRREKD